jgi:FlaG/FlaF family flagellin (archaellin)
MVGEERGISAVMGGLFMVIITITLAGILYALLGGMIRPALDFDATAEITDLNGNSHIIVNVRNAGGVKIDRVDIKILGVTHGDLSLKNIEPGDTKSLEETISTDPPIAEGTEYHIRITVHAGDESKSKTIEVYAT